MRLPPPLLARRDPADSPVQFVTVLLALSMGLASLSRPALAQQALTDLAEVQGQVFASRIVGRTLYVGGTITAAGFRAPFAAPLAIADGLTAARAPRFAGAIAPQVTSILSDGSGGWFVAGTFETIDGQPHVNLAHLDATLHVTSWSPPAPDGLVYAMATDGSTLWLGGTFTHLGATARGLGAAVSVATGQLLPWDPLSNSQISALALAGTNIYVGGSFTTIAGGSRPQLALLNATTGVAQAFNAQATTPGGVVNALAVDGSVLYVGGAFANMGGGARANVAAFNTATGALVGAWRPNPNGPVLALQATAAGVFVGGAYGTIGGGTRAGIAQVNKTNGNVTTWNANADAGITTMTLANGVLYLAGQFQHVGGQLRPTLGAVDALTALATAWQPAASSEVFTLAAGNGYVYAGGSFGDLGGLRPRTNLAAIDLVSGDLLPWAPVANNPSIVSTVRSMEFVSGTLYLGGDFSGVNGTPRQGLVAVDATTGVVLSAWNPVVDGSVVAMLPMGSLLYVGGFFNTVSGTSRAHLAALDLATGALSSWDPGANSLVWALATDGTHVFAGGNFSVMGGLAHSCVASLDPVTGAVLPWTVAINGTFKFGGQFVPPVVYALAVQGNQLFLGGSFKSTNSWFCSAVADVNTGAVGTWFAPNFFEAGLTRVNAMHSRGTTLVVGGERVDLHSFNIPDGTVTAWAPTTLYAPVISVSGGQNMFVVGWLDGGITVYVDPVALDTPFPRSAGPLALSPVVPNPVRTSGRVRFTLPSAGAVDLGLYDVSGRCVRMLLRGDVLPAGSHEVQVTTGALRPGIYLTRLHASGETRVSRMVIAR